MILSEHKSEMLKKRDNKNFLIVEWLIKFRIKISERKKKII